MQGLSPTDSERRVWLPAKAVNVHAEALEVILKGAADNLDTAIFPQGFPLAVGNGGEKPRPNLFRRGIDGQYISRTLMVLDKNAH